MLVRLVEKALRQENMIQSGQSLAAALSGGRDSVCLLHILKALEPEQGYHLSAVHVHHGLRPEADQEEGFCRDLCRRWQIPLTVYRVDVPRRVSESGESIEEAARNLRYKAFARLRADRIALAHHQQDQAETLLLHLLRGSGLKGLEGMQAVRLPYIRPLLQASRQQIEAYIQQHQLPYVEDGSNADTAFRRNRIRHELLPLLQRDYNPKIVEALAQTAALLQEEERYIQSQMPEVPEGDLSVTWLETLPINLRRRALQRWLQNQGFVQDLSYRHIEQLMKLAEGETGHRVTLAKGLTVEKSYDILHIYRRMPCADPGLAASAFQMEFLPMAEIKRQIGSLKQIPALPEEKWLQADGLTGPLVWRFHRPGDYIMAAGGRKKLKDFWMDEKVPRQERDRTLLLTDGSHVLWVVGYRISDGARITENTQQVLHVRRMEHAEE